MAAQPSTGTQTQDSKAMDLDSADGVLVTSLSVSQATGPPRRSNYENIRYSTTHSTNTNCNPETKSINNINLNPISNNEFKN